MNVDKNVSLTVKAIKENFTYYIDRNKNSGLYFNTFVFNKKGDFFDLYFRCDDVDTLPEQVEKFNDLMKKMQEYLEEIEKYLLSTLTKIERKKERQIMESKMHIDVVEVQRNNLKFDVVLVCSKRYKYFKLFDKNIGIRAEIKDGIIKSIERKNDITERNILNT